MTSPLPPVRVGIVAWNVAEPLARCLQALPAALDGLDAEVVVVDNASADGSAEVAEAAGVEVIRSDTNLGYARGMNLALRGATQPVLVALNPDTVPEPGSLRRLVGELVARPRVAVLGPLLRRPDGAIEHSVHRFPSLALLAVVNLVPLVLLPRGVRDRFWLPGALRPGRSEQVDWLVGAVHVLRAEALDPAGPYRERWFMYVEDVDLCWRLARQGWATWFAGDVEVVHLGGRSAAQAYGADVALRWNAATYDWYRLTFGGARARLFAALSLLGQLRVVLARALVAPLPTSAGRRARRRLRGWARLARLHLAVALRGGVTPPDDPRP